jgi:hypothetical protein
VKPPSTGIATPVTKSLSELPKNFAIPEAARVEQAISKVKIN